MRAHCRYNCQPTPRLVGGIQWVAGVQRMRSRDIAHTRQPSAVKATSALNLELSIEMTEPTAPLTQADIPALVKAATEALKARTQRKPDLRTPLVSSFIHQLYRSYQRTTKNKNREIAARYNHAWQTRATVHGAANKQLNKNSTPSSTSRESA